MSRNLKTAAGALALIVAAVYILRLDQVIGLWVDDGGYAVVGQALARGDGYRMPAEINPLNTLFYQPGLPFALAIPWKLFPQFPQNIYALKSVNLISVAALGVLVFIYFRKRISELSGLGVTAGTVLCPSLVFLATSSTMAECLYAAVQFAAMMAIERVTREEKYRWRFTALAGFLAGYAYLTRTVGIMVVVVGLAWIAHKRLWKHAGVYAAIAGVMIGGWLLARQERLSHFSDKDKEEMVYSGFVMQRLATTGVKASPKDLVDRLLQNSAVLAGADLGGLFVPSLYRSPSESGEEQTDITAVILGMRDSLAFGKGSMGNGATTIIVSFLLSGLVFTGLVRCIRTENRITEWLMIASVVTIISYSWTPMRFCVPLLPFWFFYLFKGADFIFGRFDVRPLRIAFVTLLALYIFDHAGYLRALHSHDPQKRPDFVRQYESTLRIAEWVNANVPKDEIVSTGNAPLVYLQTGRVVHRCPIAKCRKAGRRIYMLLGYGTDPGSRDVFLYRSGYGGHGVLQLAPNP